MSDRRYQHKPTRPPREAAEAFIAAYYDEDGETPDRSAQGIAAALLDLADAVRASSPPVEQEQG